MINYIICLPIEIKSALIGLFGTVLTIVGGLIGLKLGFFYWKKQITTQKKYEIVIEFLKALIEYYNSILDCRNGRYHLYDTEENIYKERLKRLYNKKDTLQEKQTLIEVIISIEVIDEINQIIKNIFFYEQKLVININEYLIRKRENRWINDKSDNEIEKIIFQPIDIKDDTFGKKFETEINNIKEILKEYIMIK